MSLFVDTSVWSLALRRDQPAECPEVELLKQSLERGDLIATTGLILQELLQGFEGARAKEKILEDFTALPFIAPEIEDHVNAASLRNLCRRKGLQIGTIDALIARLCIRYNLELLTTDKDFKGIARCCPLRLAAM